MTTLTIHIHDDLARQARRAGLLDDARIAAVVSSYLQREVEEARQYRLDQPSPDLPITQWLDRNPLSPSHLSSQASIDRAVAANRQAWD